MQRAPGAIGGVRIVRDHHDGLAVVAVERLQQIENLVAGLAIEIAGRLVAQQQRRVGDDGAGDADALLLAAGQLPRVVLRAIGEADDLQRDRRALAPLGSATASSAAAAARRSSRPSAPAAGCRAGRRSRCSAIATARARCRRSVLICDAGDLDAAARSADRVRPIRLSSVVLPEPDGPISARKSPCGISRLTPFSTSMRSLPRVK